MRTLESYADDIRAIDPNHVERVLGQLIQDVIEELNDADFRGEDPTTAGVRLSRLVRNGYRDPRQLELFPTP